MKNKTVSKKMSTKKELLELLLRAHKELVIKCLAASPKAMKDRAAVKEFYELSELLSDISERSFLCGGVKVLSYIFSCYFGHDLHDGSITNFGTERQLKIERRNAKRGCVEILKIPRLSYTSPDLRDVSTYELKETMLKHGEEIDKINKYLANVQKSLPRICERYFEIKMKGYGHTMERRAEEKEIKAEVKQLLDKDRIVETIDKLKFIGYQDKQACITVKKLLEFTKHPEHLTWQAIRNRYKRYKR